MRRRHTKFRKKQLKCIGVYIRELKKIIKSRGNNVHHITVYDIIHIACETIPDAKIRGWIENMDAYRFEWTPIFRQHKLQHKRLKKCKHIDPPYTTCSIEPLKIKK